MSDIFSVVSKRNGMINAAGYHSAAVTLMRSIEDALDCLFAVVQSDINANKWLNGELKASQAARTWTADKVVDQSNTIHGSKQM